MIINLTPHPVHLLDERGEVIRTWERPEGPLPRLVEEVTPAPSIDGVPIRNKAYRDCENLPPRKEGVYLIVSGLVASALRRDDLLVPNTVRNEEGQIIGADSFAQVI